MNNIKVFGLIFLAILTVSFGFCANLSVSLSLSSSSIAEGSSTTLTASISGNDTGVTASLSGDGIGTTLITSPASSGGVSTQTVGTVTTSTSKSWIITGNTADTYNLQVAVSGDGANTSGTIVLTVNTPANVTLESSTCDSDSNLSDDEVFSVTYALKNTGGTSASILNSASYGAGDFTESAPALTSGYLDLSSSQTKTVTWSFTAIATTSEQTGELTIDLSGANLSETIDCGSYTIAVTEEKPKGPDGRPGGGGPGTTTEVTKTIAIDEQNKKLGKATFSNSDNDGVDSVAINFIEDMTGTITLKMNTSPSLTVSTFKVISDQNVLNYLTFTYSGDASKIKDVNVKFSLPKTKVTDKTAIRLARYNNSVWTYYTPIVEDKGTYYSFTVAVPGFSYFAIVKYAGAGVTAKEEEKKVTEDEKKVTEDEKTTGEGEEVTGAEEGTKTTEGTKGTTETEETSYLSIIVLVALVVIVLVILVYFFRGDKKTVPKFTHK